MIPNAQLTHLGIFVHDRDRMAAFYTAMFGMVVERSTASSRAST